VLNIFIIRPKGFNIGNDIIYLGLNHFVRSAFGEAINLISLPATSRYEIHKKAGITGQTVYEVNQYGSGLIVGGGNLYENGELEIAAPALKALEVPLMLFSLSRGKIFNQNLRLVDRTDVMSDERIIMLHERANISLSRDKATKEYIDGLGCSSILGGCPTLFINEAPHHVVPLPEGGGTDALISVRTPTLMSIPISYQFKVREDVMRIIDYLRSHGYKNVKILCHDHRDIPFAASFAGIEYLYTEDAYTYLTFLKNTRLSIAYRLHAFLPCLSFDVPTIKISYDQRAFSMVETIGLEEWNVSLFEENLVNEVIARINALDELNVLKRKLESTVWKSLHDAITENLRIFASMVKDEERDR
jgi:hypothetical protein